MQNETPQPSTLWKHKRLAQAERTKRDAKNRVKEKLERLLIAGISTDEAASICQVPPKVADAVLRTIATNVTTVSNDPHTLSLELAKRSIMVLKSHELTVSRLTADLAAVPQLDKKADWKPNERGTVSATAIVNAITALTNALSTQHERTVRTLTALLPLVKEYKSASQQMGVPRKRGKKEKVPYTPTSTLPTFVSPEVVTSESAPLSEEQEIERRLNT